MFRNCPLFFLNDTCHKQVSWFSLVIKRSNSHSFREIKFTDSPLDTGAFGAARVFQNTVNFSWIHAGIFFLFSAFKIHTLYTYLTCDHKIYI